jgi:GH35 family endo-1,4-beta-xylanase
MDLRNILIAALLLLCFNIFAQNDAYHNALISQLQNNYSLAGGNWILTPNENTNISNAISYGNTTTTNNVTGQDFTKAINLNIPTAGSAQWDAGYSIPNVNTVQQGDRVLAVLWLRTVSVPLAAPGKLTVFAENSTTYHKEFELTINPTLQWQQYIIPFESSDTYNTGTLNFGFHLAFQEQILEVGGMALVNYNTSVLFSSLPQQLNIDNYLGSQPNAAWRAAADSRIEQHRKSNMQIQIVDGQDNPINNANVRVEMIRHQFAFGSAIVSRKLAGNSQFDATYQNTISNLDGNGHGFNWIVFENALKWDAWEEGWAGTNAETANTVQWLANNDIKMRGHNLVWGKWATLPNDMQANSNNPTYLKNRIDTRLSSILNYQGISEYIKEWDVLNEIVHERDLEMAFQGTPNYVTGRELYTEIFNQTKVEDPAVISYINDYNVLNFGTAHGGDYLTYKSMIQEIIDDGGSVDGIGFQAHMGGALISPDSIYAILDDCYQTFGKDIKITEYDQSDVIPDTLAAKYTGDFLKILFSHPAANGFMTWGFWDGAHWQGNAPFFYQNWLPKPTLLTFNDLVFNQWWTDSTLVTDANGNLTLRGFKGDYKITATVGGTDVIANLTLDNDLNTIIKMFPVNTQEKLLASEIKIFPNPVQDFLNIEMPYDTNWKVSLVDEQGKQVFEQSFDGKVQFYNVQQLAAGHYFMNITDGEQEITKKIIIIK